MDQTSDAMSRPQRIAALADLAERQTIKFQFERDGIRREGFAVRFEGNIAAYENVCRHLPLTLDYADNRFFTEDGMHLICKTHGAVYEPLTGLCVAGPCQGATLKRLETEIRDGAIWLV